MRKRELYGTDLNSGWFDNNSDTIISSYIALIPFTISPFTGAILLPQENSRLRGFGELCKHEPGINFYNSAVGDRYGSN